MVIDKARLDFIFLFSAMRATTQVHKVYKKRQLAIFDIIEIGFKDIRFWGPKGLSISKVSETLLKLDDIWRSTDTGIFQIIPKCFNLGLIHLCSGKTIQKLSLEFF